MSSRPASTALARVGATCSRSRRGSCRSRPARVEVPPLPPELEPEPPLEPLPELDPDPEPALVLEPEAVPVDVDVLTAFVMITPEGAIACQIPSDALPLHVAGLLVTGVGVESEPVVGDLGLAVGALDRPEQLRGHARLGDRLRACTDQERRPLGRARAGALDRAFLGRQVVQRPAAGADQDRAEGAVLRAPHRHECRCGDRRRHTEAGHDDDRDQANLQSSKLHFTPSSIRSLE